MTPDSSFKSFRVVRATAETRLAVAVRPGWSGPALLPIPMLLWVLRVLGPVTEIEAMDLGPPCFSEVMSRLIPAAGYFHSW